MKAAVDATFTMTPPRFFRSGNSKPVSCATARTFTSSICRVLVRLGSGKGPNVPKPLLLMSKILPAGTSEVKNFSNSPTTSEIFSGSARSHGKWRSLSSPTFMSGARRERLQTTISGCSFAHSSMNDFPIPEDPPVMTTEEKEVRASLSEDTVGRAAIFGRAGALTGSVSTQTIRRNMNSQNHREIIVSGIHLELTPSLKTFVREKADRLFRHEERIVRLRVELECDPKETVATRFKAKGHVVIQGPDMNAMVEADECHKAVALLVDKLDRMLSRRHQLQRAKRHHPHAVELETELPKAI